MHKIAPSASGRARHSRARRLDPRPDGAQRIAYPTGPTVQICFVNLNNQRCDLDVGN
jgi:hypothetical protein